MRYAWAIIWFGLCIGACGCEQSPQPKNTVLNFVRTLQTSQPIKLDDYLDLNELVLENSVYTYDSTLSVSENLRTFGSLFAPDGATRRLWTQKQIVVGETEVRGDTAYVEVSFLDRESHKQYYNKWGLRRTESGWLIFAFKLL